MNYTHLTTIDVIQGWYLYEICDEHRCPFPSIDEGFDEPTIGNPRDRPLIVQYSRCLKIP